MAFFANIAATKQEMHSLYRNYAHMFDMSSDHAGVGCHVNRKMARLPVLLIDHPVFLTGSMIRTIAIHYRAIIDRWLLRKFAVIQGAPIDCAMILRSFWGLCSLPFFVGIGVLTARLCNCITVRNQIYGRQLILGLDANLQGDLVIENNDLCNKQSFPPSLLGSKHDYVRLLLQCICSTASLKVHTTPKVIGFDRRCIQNNHESSAFWRILARNEHYLTYIGALMTLQMFLQLTRVNITTSLLPMLFQTTSSRGKAAAISNIVLVLVNSCGVLGSALTTKQHGREVTLTVSAVLMVFCQITIPLIVKVQIGLGGGTRMPMAYTTAMFVLTCVVSCGLSWSWGSLFWTFPGKKIQSAGQVVGMALNFALCFAQIQYFLLMLCRLKNAILAYYAMWILSII